MHERTIKIKNGNKRLWGREIKEEGKVRAAYARDGETGL